MCLRLAGWPQSWQKGSTDWWPQRRRLRGVGTVLVVACKAKRSSLSLQLWISCCQDRSRFIRPDHSSQRPCSWSVLSLLSCSSTSMTRRWEDRRWRRAALDGRIWLLVGFDKPKPSRANEGGLLTVVRLAWTTVEAHATSTAGANRFLQLPWRARMVACNFLQRGSAEFRRSSNLTPCCCFQ